MKKAKIEQLVLGMVGTNTWLIKNKESNELLIIDPADESARIEEKIDRMGGRPVAVLLTHGHFDHMLAADDLRDEYGIPIIACAAEQQVLTDSVKNLSLRCDWTGYIVCCHKECTDKQTARKSLAQKI